MKEEGQIKNRSKGEGIIWQIIIIINERGKKKFISKKTWQHIYYITCIEVEVADPQLQRRKIMKDI